MKAPTCTVQVCNDISSNSHRLPNAYYSVPGARLRLLPIYHCHLIDETTEPQEVRGRGH